MSRTVMHKPTFCTVVAHGENQRLKHMAREQGSAQDTLNVYQLEGPSCELPCGMTGTAKCLRIAQNADPT